MSARLALVRRRDERVVAYTAVAAGAFVVALFTGRVELAAFAAPFATVLVMATRSRDIVAHLDIVASTTRAVEGDEFAAVITVELDDRRPLTAEVVLSTSDDLVAVSPTNPSGLAGISWSDVGPIDQELVLRSDRWGRFVLGPAAVRVRDPHAFVHWEASTQRGPVVLVLPAAPRLDRILEPRVSRTAAGFHLSRRDIGSGMDFAELQSYQPGDRLRDLNRAATARLGTPIVNRHHPERSGEVIILLDTYIDTGFELSAAARRALLVTARASWAIARAHLAAQDRVGLATVGRIPIWLPPRAGARARYAILESLMSVGAVLEGQVALTEPIEAGRIPPAALVVYISPLWSDPYLGSVKRMQARGRETAVVQLDTDALLGPRPDGASRGDALARRLFAMGATDRADDLRQAGIPVSIWNPASALSATINAAAVQQRRSSRVVHQ